MYDKNSTCTCIVHAFCHAFSANKNSKLHVHSCMNVFIYICVD